MYLNMRTNRNWSSHVYNVTKFTWVFYRRWGILQVYRYTYRYRPKKQKLWHSRPLPASSVGERNPVVLPCRALCWAGTRRSPDKWATTLSRWIPYWDCSSLVSCTARRSRLVTLRGRFPRQLSIGWFAPRCLVWRHLGCTCTDPKRHTSYSYGFSSKFFGNTRKTGSGDAPSTTRLNAFVREK